MPRTISTMWTCTFSSVWFGFRWDLFEAFASKLNEKKRDNEMFSCDWATHTQLHRCGGAIPCGVHHLRFSSPRLTIIRMPLAARSMVFWTFLFILFMIELFFFFSFSSFFNPFASEKFSLHTQKHTPSVRAFGVQCSLFQILLIFIFGILPSIHLLHQIFAHNKNWMVVLIYSTFFSHFLHLSQPIFIRVLCCHCFSLSLDLYLLRENNIQWNGQSICASVVFFFFFITSLHTHQRIMRKQTKSQQI